MKTVFVDTDVIIDLLINRQPFATAAATLFSEAESGNLRVAISSLSMSNVYYIIRKEVGHSAALKLLDQLARLVDILPVNRTMILQSLNSEFRDFEDAIQNYCAESAPGISVILTRNISDFTVSNLSVLTPDSFLNS